MEHGGLQDGKRKRWRQLGVDLEFHDQKVKKKMSGIEWNPGKPQSYDLSDWKMVSIAIKGWTST